MITAYGGQASTKNPILVVDESRLSAVIRQPVPPAVSFQGLTRDRLERRPVGSLPPSKPPTGPAPPRRSVCAPGTMSLHCIADQSAIGEPPMLFTSWLRTPRPALTPDRAERSSRRRQSGRGRGPRRLILKQLEDRSLPSGTVSLAPSEPAPQLVGEAITWTATATDCGANPV